MLQGSADATLAARRGKLVQLRALRRRRFFRRHAAERLGFSQYARGASGSAS